MYEVDLTTEVECFIILCYRHLSTIYVELETVGASDSVALRECDTILHVIGVALPP